MHVVTLRSVQFDPKQMTCTGPAQERRFRSDVREVQFIAGQLGVFQAWPIRNPKGALVVGQVSKFNWFMVIWEKARTEQLFTEWCCLFISMVKAVVIFHLYHLNPVE